MASRTTKRSGSDLAANPKPLPSGLLKALGGSLVTEKIHTGNAVHSPMVNDNPEIFCHNGDRLPGGSAEQSSRVSV